VHEFPSPSTSWPSLSLKSYAACQQSADASAADATPQVEKNEGKETEVWPGGDKTNERTH
jgi:hypothetical protein